MPDKESEAREWFAHGYHDLQSAKTLLAEKGFADTAAMLVQQAAEKYLKGYLIYHGWTLIKTHDLRRLVAEAVKHNPEFSAFRDFARRATAYYLDHRYPPGPPAAYPIEEITALVKQAEAIIALIKRETG